MSKVLRWIRQHRQNISAVAYWTAVVAVCLFFLMVCLHAVAGPWQWGHNGFNGASYAQAARNTIRFGNLAQAKYYTGLEPPEVEEFFTHHPMMIHFHLIGVFTLFGVSELAGRMVPAIYSFLSLVLLFLIVRRYFGKGLALASIVAYSLIPLNLIYANMIDHEQGSIFWCLFMILAYTRWKETYRWLWFVLVMVGTSISVHFAWPGYYIALVLVIHAFLSGVRKQTRILQWQPEYTFSAIYSVVVLGNFYLFYDFIVGLRGDFSEMRGAFELRSSMPGGYFATLWERSLDLQGPLFIALLAAWAFYCVVRAARREVHYGDLVPFSFFFAQLVQSLLFKQAGYIHAYWTYHAAPTLAVGGAAVVLGVAKGVPRALGEIGQGFLRMVKQPADRFSVYAHPVGVVLSIAIVITPLWYQARYAHEQFWWGYDTGSAAYSPNYEDQYLDIRWAQHFTHRFNRTNSDFLLPPNHRWRIEFFYYLDAPCRVVTSTRLPSSVLTSERNQVFLFDLNLGVDRRRLARLVQGHQTMVYDRRFVVVNASDDSGQFEAFIHQEEDPPPGWHWFVNPSHPPIRWIPDPDPEVARALFETTVEIVAEREFGGPGGGPTEWDCPPGQVLNGFTVVTLRTWVEHVARVEPHCRPLPPPPELGLAVDTSWESLSRSLSTGFGEPGGDIVRHRLVCEAGQALVGIYGRHGGLPDAMGILCAPVSVRADDQGGVLLEVGEPIPSALVGGEGGQEFQFTCPEGSLGVGFRGRVGNITDAVGISCARINPGFWGSPPGGTPDTEQPLERRTGDTPAEKAEGRPGSWQ